MNMKVVEERENPLMKRKEVLVSLDYNTKSTVSKADLQKAVADELKAAIDSVEVTKILSEVGISRGKAWIKVWNEKKVPIYSELKKVEAKPEAPKEEAPKKE